MPRGGTCLVRAAGKQPWSVSASGRIAFAVALSDDGRVTSGGYEASFSIPFRVYAPHTLVDAGVVNARREKTRYFVALRPELDERFPGLLAAVLQQAGEVAPGRRTTVEA